MQCLCRDWQVGANGHMPHLNEYLKRRNSWHYGLPDSILNFSDMSFYKPSGLRVVVAQIMCLKPYFSVNWYHSFELMGWPLSVQISLGIPSRQKSSVRHQVQWSRISGREMGT